ncbi:hypothetical protein [Glycomyces xiaoerkulensis]|uniref:hypothetical protein n=1 Tax=Glycomyces xiaoerkulensis TaxID=2038139 RepID=UPI000C260B75|nr:hypothetical protein [Glycomyces xiaoerkulensis]
MSERAQDGLLGMALHPDRLTAEENQYVYLSYIYSSDPGVPVWVVGMRLTEQMFRQPVALFGSISDGLQ